MPGLHESSLGLPPPSNFPVLSPAASSPAEQLIVLVQVPRAGMLEEGLEPLSPRGGLCVCDVPSHCLSATGGTHPGQILPLPLLPTSLPLQPWC